MKEENGIKMCIGCGAVIRITTTKCPYCGTLQGHMKTSINLKHTILWIFFRITQTNSFWVGMMIWNILLIMIILFLIMKKVYTKNRWNKSQKNWQDEQKRNLHLELLQTRNKMNWLSWKVPTNLSLIRKNFKLWLLYQTLQTSKLRNMLLDCMLVYLLQKNKWLRRVQWGWEAIYSDLSLSIMKVLHSIPYSTLILIFRSWN